MRLKGYYKKWTPAKCILGCMLFVGLLTPCAVINILEALTGVLKTLKETDKLASKHLDQWSMYAATVSKCTTDEDGSTVYQMQELKDFSEAQGYFSSKYEYCHKNSQCVKSRLSWSDMQLMRDIVFMLSLHGLGEAGSERK